MLNFIKSIPALALTVALLSVNPAHAAGVPCRPGAHDQSSCTTPVELPDVIDLTSPVVPAVPVVAGVIPRSSSVSSSQSGSQSGSQSDQATTCVANGGYTCQQLQNLVLPVTGGQENGVVYDRSGGVDTRGQYVDSGTATNTSAVAANSMQASVKAPADGVLTDEQVSRFMPVLIVLGLSGLVLMWNATRHRRR